MKTWQKWQDAQNTLQKKREIEAKLLWANKPDKLQQAKEEITEVMKYLVQIAGFNVLALVKNCNSNVRK